MPQVAQFAATLKEHQLAVGSDGLTVLARAVIEHNLLSVSKVPSPIPPCALSGRAPPHRLRIPCCAQQSVIARLLLTQTVVLCDPLMSH